MLTPHPLNAVNFFNARLTLGITKKKETRIVWFTVVNGTCSLYPEGSRRIRKGIRRRSRVGGSRKTRWTEKRKRKEMEKGLMNSKFTFKTLPDGSVNRTKVICTFCRHEMSYHLSTSSRGGKHNRFLDESRFGRGWFWINSHVNSQHNVDGTQEAELRSVEVQHPDSWRRAHNKKHGMCRECLYSQTNHGWNVWGICSRRAAQEQRGDHCWLLADSC